MGQAAAAGKAAEAAEKRCEELQWRLQQQDVSLAQRTELVQEARAAAEGLTKVRSHANHICSFRDTLNSIQMSTCQVFSLPVQLLRLMPVLGRQRCDLHVEVVLLRLALADGVRRV